VSPGASCGWCGDELFLGVALAVAGGALLLTVGGSALSVAFDVHFQDDGVVNEAVDCGKGHGGIWKDGCPFPEWPVGGDQQAAAFISGSNQLEQYAGFSLITMDVAEIVKNDQVILVELIDGGVERQRLPGGLQALHHLGGAGEQHAVAVLDEGVTECGGEMRFAGSARAEQQDVDRLHPQYLPLVGEFIRRDPVRPLRESLDVARLANRARNGAILFFNHTWGGGTERHAQEMARLLEDHGTPVFFCRVASDDPGFLRLEDAASPELPNLPIFEVARDVGRFARTLATIGVRHIHIQHLAGMPESTADFIRSVARATDLAYDLTVHDYIAICPRIVLVDRSGVYCGEPPIDVCEDCVRRDGSPFGNPSVWEWRERYARLLLGARRVFIPDQDVGQRLRRFFPTVNFEVRPHLMKSSGDLGAQRAARKLPERLNRRRRIAILGAISNEKGSGLLFDTANAAKSRDLPMDFIVVGYTNRDDELTRLGNVEITGRYEEEETATRLLAVDPDLVWFPAVWPETFSYTLSAVFAAGLFPVAFNIGALASRIRAVNWGTLWPMEAMLDPARLAEMLLREPIPPTPSGLDRSKWPDYSNPLTTYYDLHTAF